MQQAVQNVSVSADVIDYIIALSHVSRNSYSHANKQEEKNCKPLSPRATKALLSAAKAYAFIDDRNYVLPDDVQAVFYVVCQHRLEMNSNHTVGHYHDEEQKIANSVATQILNSVDVLNPLGF